MTPPTVADAGQLPEGATVEADVCVIGAGPAGSTVARELAAAGRDVLLLDSGGRRPDAASADLADGERVGLPYVPLPVARQRAFGGTSHSWPWIEGWRARPLGAIDLEPGRGRDAGWPIDHAELARWYPEAERRCGLHPAVADPAEVATPATPPLPLDPELVRTSVFRYSRTTFTDPATALGGAPVRVLLRATAAALRRSRGAGQPVDRVEALGPGGRRLTVAAGTIVVACGGIGTATLLLASDRDDPDGMGNASGLLGRCFMERLTYRAAALDLADRDLGEGLGLYAIHRVDGLGVQGVLTPAEPLLRRHGLRNVALFLEVRDAAAASAGMRSAAALAHVRDRSPVPPDLTGHAAAVLREAPALAAVAARRVTGRLPGPLAGGAARVAARLPGGEPVLLLRAQAEPRPLQASRVTLGTSRDHLGLPRARLDWRVDPADLASVQQAAELVGAAFAAAGLGRLRPVRSSRPAPLVEGAHHHLGTTRMHPDPRRGVVDADGRVHGTDTVYVASSSVFPTAGYANPTLTIVALALRLGAHLAA